MRMWAEHRHPLFLFFSDCVHGHQLLQVSAAMTSLPCMVRQINPFLEWLLSGYVLTAREEYHRHLTSHIHFGHIEFTYNTLVNMYPCSDDSMYNKYYSPKWDIYRLWNYGLKSWSNFPTVTSVPKGANGLTPKQCGPRARLLTIT